MLRIWNISKLDFKSYEIQKQKNKTEWKKLQFHKLSNFETLSSQKIINIEANNAKT